MDIFTAIETRRSVKHYDPNHRMTETEIDRLLESARFSPTSFNMQNWRFVVVADPKKKVALREAAWGQAQCEDASIVIVLCAHLNAHEDGERYWGDAPETIRKVLVPMIAPFYENKPQLQRDEAMRSIGMAAQTIMLAAKATGYDSCPMIGFEPDKVGDIIKLPEDHVIGMMIAVGKALKSANPRGGRLAYEEVVFSERFPE